MPFDPRTWIWRSWIRRPWIRRLGVACCGGVLACAVCLAPVPGAAQSFLHAYSQTSVGVGCFELGCDCYDNGVAKPCPVRHESYYDSGPVFGTHTHTHDTHTADVIGRYQLYDGETRSQMSLNTNAGYGHLRGSLWTRAFTGGAYIEGGGLAVPGDASVSAGLEFADDLMLRGAVPSGPVSLQIWQDISSTDFELIRGSDNYPVTNLCLANGDATTRLYAILNTTHLGLGGGDQSVSYFRQTNECSAPTVTGLPRSSIAIDGADGDFVHIGETVNLNSTVYLGGGLGLPNRVTYAESYLNASNSAQVIVEVLTPGASFTSASGALYQVPESEGGAGELAAGAALLVALGLRRSAAASTRHS